MATEEFLPCLSKARLNVRHQHRRHPGQRAKDTRADHQHTVNTTFVLPAPLRADENELTTHQARFLL